MNVKELIRSIVVWLLTLEARAVLATYRPSIIVVTGSVGKTSAKDAIFSACTGTHFVRRSEKSYNSDIGAPLTVLGLPNGWANPIIWLRNLIDGLVLILVRVPYPRWLIVEVGADRPGDISRSLSWIAPRIVVATRFPAVPVHVEFYDSPEAVMHEELAPISWLRPGGVFVGNGDDPIVCEVEVPEGVERMLYGTQAHADVRAQRIKVLTERGLPRGMSFDVVYRGERAHVALRHVVGAPHLYAALAGITAALAADVPLATAAAQFATHKAPPGRGCIIPGSQGSVIIDDSYNASPVAVAEALETLAHLPTRGKRIAVIGDMLELGPYTAIEHEKAGARAATAATHLVTVGVRARKTADGALAAGMVPETVVSFDRALDAAEYVKGVVTQGDVILVKGSQGMRLERAVKMLMAEPDRAKELLCRQDAEWLAR